MPTAGVMLVLSALLELFAINSHVPLFGNVQGGMIKAYHSMNVHTLEPLLFLPVFVTVPAHPAV